MTKKIFILIISLFLFFKFVHTDVFSLTPTPFTKLDCGYANDPNANKCCSTGLIDLEEAKKQANNSSPLIGQFLDKLPNLDLDKKFAMFGSILNKCYLGEPDETSGTCICKQSVNPTPVTKLKEICNKFTKSEERAHCLACTNGGGILTDLGCIPLNIGNFISDYLLGRLIGLAGLIALLCIIYSAFQLQTSGGNAEKVKKAQELLTSCIMGLMLIIFSVFILRLVGISILRIPGFS